jgi:hypothetical protein
MFLVVFFLALPLDALLVTNELLDPLKAHHAWNRLIWVLSLCLQFSLQVFWLTMPSYAFLNLFTLNTW